MAQSSLPVPKKKKTPSGGCTADKWVWVLLRTFRGTSGMTRRERKNQKRARNQLVGHPPSQEGATSG